MKTHNEDGTDGGTTCLTGLMVHPEDLPDDTLAEDDLLLLVRWNIRWGSHRWAHFVTSY